MKWLGGPLRITVFERYLIRAPLYFSPDFNFTISELVTVIVRIDRMREEGETQTEKGRERFVERG